MMTNFDDVASRLETAVRQRVFPSASVEVGGSGGPQWRHAVGRLDYDEQVPTTNDTVYDLASLSKVIATTTVVMQLVDRGGLRLEDPLDRWFPDWRGADRTAVTVADLLEHASGLTAHLPFFRDHHGRQDYQHAICTLPLEYTPRTQSIYSDLGFILLGFLVGDVADRPLDEQFERWAARVELGDLRYRPPVAWRARVAPTEVDPWRGRLLRGEVHDENGWALGGVAGHTGLFGTAPAVGRFARAVLGTLAGSRQVAAPATLTRFLRQSSVPGSSRALGWDTMLVTSSCGHRLSAQAFGHTGFTGTSLWIDPAQDLYIVLLTNRVHPTRANEAILTERPHLHDAIVEANGRPS
ncbi:MAG: serine hydrolase domain-containing protein [Acidobacteriota bacterium]|nr:serine hydrolase domain-containing protein [Acidobacteriota bacterium]